MQWKDRPLAFMRRTVRQVMNQEETLQLRIPEGMPDVGTVLGVWGQPVLRSKQWRTDAMSVSGGVQATVLYAPQDGGQPEILEGWLPYGSKWSFSDSRREGSIRVQPLLRSLDARVLSGRKILLRACLGVLGEAWEADTVTVFHPEDRQENVELLETNYPLRLVKETGEKLVDIEEELMPSHAPEKLLAITLEPQVTEQNVVGEQAVFKGSGRVHLIYRDNTGRLWAEDMELPFAQFAELSESYEKGASLRSLPVVSSLEAEVSGDSVKVKAGLILQYMLLDTEYLHLWEDAYCPTRQLELTRQVLEIPVVLEESRLDWQEPVLVDEEELELLEQHWMREHPTVYREGESLVAEIPVTRVVLGRDGEGKLQSRTESTVQHLEFPAGEGCSMSLELTNGAVERLCCSQQSFPMLTGLEPGEALQPDPHRPSLLLRRMGEESLWSIAKVCGSTVEAIQKANPSITDPNQMLLIPIL